MSRLSVSVHVSHSLNSHSAHGRMKPSSSVMHGVDSADTGVVGTTGRVILRCGGVDEGAMDGGVSMATKATDHDDDDDCGG